MMSSLCFYVLYIPAISGIQILCSGCGKKIKKRKGGECSDCITARTRPSPPSSSSPLSSSSSFSPSTEIDLDSLFSPIKHFIINGEKKKRNNYNYYYQYENDFFIHLFNNYINDPSSPDRENDAFEYLFSFLEDVTNSCINYGIKNVYNYDETPLPTAPSSIFSFQLYGKPSVPIPTNGQVERVYSIGATVSALGEKLPLLFIKKGVRENAASVISLQEVVDDHDSDLILTKSGWINEDAFIYYLECVFKPNVNTPCALIVDVYRAHRTDAVLQKAKDLNIHLIFVPAGHTGELQPLDVGVFGPVKSICKKNYDPLTHPLEYVDCFQSYFYNFSSNSIQKAFKESFALDDELFNPELNNYCELINNSLQSVIDAAINANK